MELLVRFLVGGTVVSFFAIVGDALKPEKPSLGYWVQLLPSP